MDIIHYLTLNKYISKWNIYVGKCINIILSVFIPKQAVYGKNTLLQWNTSKRI